MKKYVRTDKHVTSREAYERARDIVMKYPDFATLDLVVEDSDDLKDLCDYVVVEWYNGLPTVFDLWYETANTIERADFEQIVSFTDEEKQKIVNIYGAIWDKSNITCVAKLNKETGELELI